MPLEFTCPHCAASTLIADEFSGKTGPCAHCGRDVDIPVFAPQRLGRSSSPSLLQTQQAQAIAAGIAVLLIVVLLGVGITTAIPVWRQAHAERQQEQCAENLRVLGQALRAYVADFGRLPMSHAVDANGTPLYSWRVVILPYLGEAEKQIHRQLNLNEPWSSPQNRYLLTRMPEVFASPADADAVSLGEPSYHLIVGNATAFPPGKGLSLDAIRDDPATTIMLIEGRMRSGKSWAEPADLTPSPALFRLGQGGTQRLGGNHASGAQALFFDDEVRLIPLGTAPNLLEAMFNIADEVPQEDKTTN